jgi:DNA-binding response OmpR family regulator
MENMTSLNKGPFILDFIERKAFLLIEDKSPKNLKLTPTEYKLLAIFVKNDGQIFSRDELRATIWGPTVHVSPHTVATHISSLRKKLGNLNTCLKAVMKRGYSLDIPETPIAATKAS